MRITVYTTPTCAQCDQTKKRFDKHGVRYDVVDLSTDPAAMEQIKGLGYTAAPVVIAGDKHWSGFRLTQIDDVAHQLFGEDRRA